MEPIETPDTVNVRVVCPACGESGLVPIDLASRLTMVAGERSKLGVRAKAPTLPHLCGQLTIAEAMRKLEDGNA